nr:4-hydroxyphenylalkanoate adenylyltransferase [uncultured bacterium]
MKGPSLPPSRFSTLNEMLVATTEQPGGLTFLDLQERERFFGWKEILARAQGVAGALHDLGVRRGQRVALVLPTCPEFTDAFYGVLLAGAVPVPLYPPLRLGRLAEFHRATTRMLCASSASLVVTNGPIQRLLGQAVAGARPPLGCTTVEELQARQETLPLLPVSPDDLALIQFSSGSTVDPKPVALTHRQLLAQCAALHRLVPPREGALECAVCWLPLYHDMGLIGLFLNAAYYPGHLVLISPEDFLARPALWLRAMGRHRALASAAPNFAYGLCVKRISDGELEGVDLSHWRIALCGAEPVSPVTLRRFAERFGRFGFPGDALMPVYGLSEATLAVTFSPPRALRTVVADPERLAQDGVLEVTKRFWGRELVSVGAPIPGMEIQIRGEAGEDLPEGHQGRIHVRGPSVMRGYFDAPEASARALTDGWLDTGDLGVVREGELFLTGRTKDLIIIRGANHAPQEFEDCLYDVGGVRAGCAVALGYHPPGVEGEALLLLVEHGRDSRERLAERVREAVGQRTGIRPHHVEVLPPGTLPRTSSGKLRRQEALRQYLNGELRPPRDVNAFTLGWEAVRSTLAFARARRPQ